MMQNAPHLVRNQSFVIPAYAWWNSPFYTIGLKVYDLMAGKLGLGPSKSISKEATIEALPTISQKDLREVLFIKTVNSMMPEWPLV
jgi:glycerol-3-phosphate dehydrogenase